MVPLLLGMFEMAATTCFTVYVYRVPTTTAVVSTDVAPTGLAAALEQVYAEVLSQEHSFDPDRR